MPTVKFTSALKRFYPDLRDTVVEGQTVFRATKHR